MWGSCVGVLCAHREKRVAVPGRPALELCAWGRVCRCVCAQGATISRCVVSSPGDWDGCRLGHTLCMVTWGGLSGLLLQLQSSSLLAVTLALPEAQFSLNVSDSKMGPRIFSPLLASQDQSR